MAKLISKTYGEALFELAVEENKVDVFEQEISAILEILNQNPDFLQLLNHPKISKEEKLRHKIYIISSEEKGWYIELKCPAKYEKEYLAAFEDILGSMDFSATIEK